MGEEEINKDIIVGIADMLLSLIRKEIQSPGKSSGSKNGSLGKEH
ncbi:MAG: hypothetical protein Q8O89_04930 [Nanoarchaeota archaeon]|nr:hypothetical protein [Nanoarchaeota archaeon]